MKSHAPKPCVSWLQRWRIRQHFAGSITPGSERSMREHLGGCPHCTAYYDAHLRLAELDPRAKPAFERIGRGLGLVHGDEQRSRLPLLLAAAAAAALLLVLGTSRFPDRGGGTPAAETGPPPSEFAARGATLGTDDAAIRVYRNPAAGRSELVSGYMAAGDELSFAYTNRRGFKYLLVLGVDEQGKVFWYYPAWTDAAQAPSAVPIQASVTLVELPDAIRHELSGKRLRLLSIFANTPLPVRQVEERLSSMGASHEGQLFQGTLEQELSLEVR